MNTRRYWDRFSIAMKKSLLKSRLEGECLQRDSTASLLFHNHTYDNGCIIDQLFKCGNRPRLTPLSRSSGVA
jgi:hypothetical protein